MLAWVMNLDFAATPADAPAPPVVVADTVTPGRREKKREAAEERRHRLWLPSQVRGETEAEKRARRLAQGIERDETAVAAAARAADLAAAEAARLEREQRELAALRADVTRLREEAMRDRWRARARTAARTAELRVAKLDKRIAQLVGEQQLRAARAIEEADIAFIISVLAELD